MGTAILRSQDCLRGRFPMTLSPRAAASSRRSPNFSSANPNPGPYGSQSRRRRRSPVAVAQNERTRGFGGGGVDRSRAMVAKAPGKSLVMEQVKILKRGESLSPPPPQTAAATTKRGGGGGGDRKPRARSVGSSGSVSDLALGSTDRLGPDPETVQKQIKAAEFKVMDAIYAGSGAYYASPPPSSVPLPAFLGRNGAATSDLRRLLGLGSV